MTTIEWTHRPGTKGATWNPFRGCRVFSPGCENCYAMRQAHRFSGKGGPYEGLTQLRNKGPVWTGKGRLVGDTLGLPLRWRTPRTVFVNSMSDLWFEKFTNEEIAAVFGVMAACPQHTFQILTKRAARMREWFEWAGAPYEGARYPSDQVGSRFISRLERFTGPATTLTGPWPLPNVWLGVSVENQKYADERITELLRTPAAVRFVSYEPALGPVDFYPWLLEESIRSTETILNWIICGGESGPGARPFCQEWAEKTIEQCKAAGVPCFFKQYGAEPIDGDGVAITLKDRKGGDAREWPKALRVREWPEVRP